MWGDFVLGEWATAVFKAFREVEIAVREAAASAAEGREDSFRRGTQQARRKRRYVVAVEPVESVPMRCIAVDSPGHLYLAGKAMIPTHNTNLEQAFAGRHIELHPDHWLLQTRRAVTTRRWE